MLQLLYIYICYICACYWRLVSLVLLRCPSISTGINGAEINALEHPEGCQRQMALIDVKLTTVKLLDLVGDFHVSMSPHLERSSFLKGDTNQDYATSRLSMEPMQFMSTRSPVTRLPSQRRDNLSSLLLKVDKSRTWRHHFHGTLPTRIWRYCKRSHANICWHAVAPLAAHPCLLQKPWRPSVWKQLYRFSYAHERTPKSFRILHLSPVKYNFSCKSPSSTQFQAGWVCDWGEDKRSMQTFTIPGFQETSVTRRPDAQVPQPNP